MTNRCMHAFDRDPRPDMRSKTYLRRREQACSHSVQGQGRAVKADGRVRNQMRRPKRQSRPTPPFVLIVNGVSLTPPTALTASPSSSHHGPYLVIRVVSSAIKVHGKRIRVARRIVQFQLDIIILHQTSPSDPCTTSSTLCNSSSQHVERNPPDLTTEASLSAVQNDRTDDRSAHRR
jgi:hypothetical protein